MVIVFSLVALWVLTSTAAGIAFGRSLTRSDAKAPLHEQITPGAARLDFETGRRRAAPSFTTRFARHLAPAHRSTLS